MKKRDIAALAAAFFLTMIAMASGPAATSKGSTTLETTTVIVDPMALGGEVRSHSATPTLSSIVMGCGPLEHSLCYGQCEDEASRTGGRVISSSCKGWNERMSLVCSCTIAIPPPGPFIPPCYWNCGAGRLVGNGIY